MLLESVQLSVQPGIKKTDIMHTEVYQQVANNKRENSLRSGWNEEAAHTDSVTLLLCS